MENKKKILIIIGVIGIIVILGFSYYFLNIRENIENITVNDIYLNMDTDDGDQKIDWEKYQEKSITLNSSLTITEGGIYNLTGSIKDGMITINTNDDVKLILDNVTIDNSNGPAIYVQNANNTVISLKENTINTLADGENYSLYDEDVNAIIYSKDDLVIEGLGKLIINANYEDAIVSKDDLKIISGIYEINAQDDGIRGKDSVYIIDADIKITSGGDGIKATNDTDSNKGFIKIENGNFDIISKSDGIQAKTNLLIINGNFNIKTKDGSTNSNNKENNDLGMWGKRIEEPIKEDTSSAKGIKASGNIVIENGIFNIDSYDDAIHSNNYIGIKNANVIISSSDDGIHADKEIVIDSGDININKSYEGIEAAKITINNGNIYVSSSDDGINVAGGNDASSINGRPGQNNFNSNTNNILTINDGNIHVVASGDGIDVNGSGYINGGNIIVEGPTDNQNGALDYDGEFAVNGGSLIASGASGMAQYAGKTSTQYNIIIFFNKTIENGKKVTIVDSDNNEVLSYTSSKLFSSLVFSSKDLKKGNYQILVDNENYQSFEINDISTIIGNNLNNNQGDMPNRGDRPMKDPNVKK